MAGFFGLFDYEKEGPGIDPNAPKKKPFFVFFETFFRNFWRFMPINAVYTVLFLPVIFNGLASVGLTHVTRNIARDKHSFGLSDFWDTVKRNWKQGLCAGIFNAIVFALIGFSLWFYSHLSGIGFALGVGLSAAILFIFLIMNFYVWTMIITFNLRLPQVYRNAFRFVFINLKNNLICGISLIGVYAFYIFVLLLLPYYLTLYIAILLFIFTFPAFRFLLIQFCTFSAIKKYMIDPYYEAHPGEDIEKRRSLGLDIPEEDKKEEKPELESETEAD